MSEIEVQNNVKDTTKKMYAFSAIDPFKTSAIPLPKENEVRGQTWVVYGERNGYPNFLYSLYQEDATLQSIVDGMIDYVKGEDMTLNVDLGWGPGIVNRTGERIEKFLESCVSDLVIFGGFYIQVVRSNDKKVKELYWLDYRFMRTDRRNEVFYYSEDFVEEKTYGRCKTLLYSKFVPDFVNDETSVFFFKRSQSRGVYATPIYNGAIKSIVTDMKINNFSLNEVENNFTASALINFNNGTPDDKLKKEIERDLEEKMTGSENAGRFMVSYNEDADHATTIERIQADDFDKRYEALQKRVQAQIYVSMRACPQLFGMPVEGTGFAGQEYSSAYALFNKTVVQPMQTALEDTMDYILGVKGSISITPFQIELPNNE